MLFFNSLSAMTKLVLTINTIASFDRFQLFNNKTDSEFCANANANINKEVVIIFEIL